MARPRKKWTMRVLHAILRIMCNIWILVVVEVVVDSESRQAVRVPGWVGSLLKERVLQLTNIDI